MVRSRSTPFCRRERVIDKIGDWNAALDQILFFYFQVIIHKHLFIQNMSVKLWYEAFQSKIGIHVLLMKQNSELLDVFGHLLNEM